MQFVEFPHFTRWVEANLSDEEYRQIQEELIKNPHKGDLIPHGHGLRKLRWRFKGKGKSGGVRIIYYLWLSHEEFLMIYVYPKNEREDLTKEQLRTLARVTKENLR
jgi:mRNA-degrading endonuclease RelE of RelBE toxin-antitoxin system